LENKLKNAIQVIIGIAKIGIAENLKQSKLNVKLNFNEKTK